MIITFVFYQDESTEFGLQADSGIILKTRLIAGGAYAFFVSLRFEWILPPLLEF